jgi:hypothetical protein
MKHTMTTLGALMAATTPALAFGGPESAGTGVLVPLFMGFGVLIVVCQLIPGMALFWSILKTLFGKATRETALAAGR